MARTVYICIKEDDMETLNKQIGGLIKTARQNAKLSQRDLAEKLCVSPPTVNKYENKGQNLTIATLNKIAKALETELIIGSQA